MNDIAPMLAADAARKLHEAACKMARGLAHGQRQFYSLAQVRAQAGTVDASLTAWMFAAFVSRDDFEALYAMRETPGSYRAMRAALSAPESRSMPDAAVFNPEDGVDVDIDDLWWLLSVAVDA